MGCNCKKQVLNNTDNIFYLEMAKDVYENTVMKKGIQNLDDADKHEISAAFRSLYPNAKAGSSVEDNIHWLEKAREEYLRKKPK